MLKQIEKMYVKPGSKVKLDKHPTDYKKKPVNKEEEKTLLNEGVSNIVRIQEMLYSHNQYSVLIIIQAMDAAGKDSLVKHVLSGLNPTGVKVTPYGTPTKTELEHDYLWRHNKALPGRGEIGIFVRSHYENVLVTRVHPEYIVGENIPGYDKIDKIDKALFKTRFRQINDWERYLTENGTKIIKIFLHSGKEEQKKQLMERIEDPAKHWKFNFGDIEERQLWDKYMVAYEDLLNNTSTESAPWYIVPADDRWFARVAASKIIEHEMDKLHLHYPLPDAKLDEQLAKAKSILLNEKE